MKGIIKFIVVFSAVAMLIILLFFLYNYFWGPKYTTQSHEIDEDFNDVSISTDTADIIFLPSEDGKCRVVFHTLETETHSVKVKDGRLCIDTLKGKRWYEYIRIDFGTPTITVYLPRGEYARLTVKRSTGDVEIPKDFSFDSIDISGSTGDTICSASAESSIRIEQSTGDITLTDLTCNGNITTKVSTGNTFLTNVRCESLISDGSTGKISITNLIAEKKIKIERDTGDVKLDKCDAGEIFIKTDTGKVFGTLLSNKIFSVSSDTGKIEVPKSIDGGRCEIITDTGDIKISIVG